MMNIKKLACEYLPNYYSKTVHNWARAFYNAGNKELNNVLSSGIERYREFVDTLPYGNISRVAKVFNMQDKTTCRKVQFNCPNRYTCQNWWNRFKTYY